MSMPIGRTLDNPGTADPIVWDRPADQVRNGINRQVQRIRDQRGLTPEASQALMAAAYLKGKAQLDGMNTANPAQRAPLLAAAKRAAFGVDDLLKGTSETDKAAVMLSFRDAQQRAAQLSTAGEARALLDTAMQTGDELLTRAVGNHALSSMDMGDTAQTYLDSHPAQAQAVQALADLQQPLSMAVLWEFVTPKPPELSGLTDYAIADLAAKASKYTG